MWCPQLKEPFCDEGRPRIKPFECDLPELQYIFPRHGVGYESRALIGIIGEFVGYCAVFIEVVIKVSPGERSYCMEVGNVRIEVQCEFYRLEPFFEGLAGDAEHKRRTHP